MSGLVPVREYSLSTLEFPGPLGGDREGDMGVGWSVIMHRHYSSQSSSVR